MDLGNVPLQVYKKYHYHYVIKIFEIHKIINYGNQDLLSLQWKKIEQKIKTINLNCSRETLLTQGDSNLLKRFSTSCTCRECVYCIGQPRRTQDFPTIYSVYEN